MIEIWLDSHLSPAVARWLTQSFPDVHAVQIRSVGLREADDPTIFDAAASTGVIVVSKDNDFRELFLARRPSPIVVLLTCGNTSNARLIEILEAVMPRLLSAINDGVRYFEIQDENSLS